jgi:hypothetical protein
VHEGQTSYIALDNNENLLVPCGLLIFTIAVCISKQNDAAFLRGLLFLPVCVYWCPLAQGHWVSKNVKMKIQVLSSHTISYVFSQYISGNATCFG